jgi:hypothetical protein
MVSVLQAGVFVCISLCSSSVGRCALEACRTGSQLLTASLLLLLLFADMLLVLDWPVLQDSKERVMHLAGFRSA